jgi:hypothetical protein
VALGGRGGDTRPGPPRNGLRLGRHASPVFPPDGPPGNSRDCRRGPSSRADGPCTFIVQSQVVLNCGNDLIVIRDGEGSVDALEGNFKTMWDAAQPMIKFAAAINALEPHLARLPLFRTA